MSSAYSCQLGGSCPHGSARVSAAAHAADGPSAGTADVRRVMMDWARGDSRSTCRI